MGPFSHLTMAVQLAPVLRPGNLDEFYWGAVAPDIRYLAYIQREKTHISQECIDEYEARYPHLRSFLLGYRVHVLTDQVDINRMIRSTFPVNVITKIRRKPISQQQTTMLVEMYYLRTANGAGRLAGEYNEVLADLGILPEQALKFQHALQRYFLERSFDAALPAFQEIGMIQSSRVERYLKAYQNMQKQGVLSSLFLHAVQNARINANVVDYVRTCLTNQVHSSR